MKKINVIQNTHWDYEWYFTNDQSTVLFEFFMKELLESLENGKSDYFILDGQMGIVEKYLESFPEDAERIKKLNLDGKLSIGPWFTQTDQMIISAESVTRNLLTGFKIADKLGGAWKMGYVPDSFGQSINMPKIYNGFGIDKMIFWRGLSDSKLKAKEFIWKSDDDSRVTALNIPEGYYSGGAIYWGVEDGALDLILKDKFKNSSIEDQIVLSLSGDQRYVDLDVKEKINELNSKFDNYKFELSNYETFFNILNKEGLPELNDELLDSQDSKIHRSIYSHRYDHKYLNDYIERLITNILEPLNAISVSAGIRNHSNIIDMAWRLLLLNSAHDSAGGCNSDITNEHILNRFKRAAEITESHIDILIRKISETAYDGNELILFNTLTSTKKYWENINVITKEENLSLIKNGKIIDYDLIEKEKVYYGSINRKEEDNDTSMYYYRHTISFNHNVKALSYDSLEISKEGINKTLDKIIKNEIENEHLKISYEDGMFNLNIKDANENHLNFLSLYSDADDGDTYDYSPLKYSERISHKIKEADVKVIEGDTFKELEISGFIEINSNLEQWNENNPSTTKQDIKIKLSLVEKMLKVNIQTTNKAKDFRLRLGLNTGINFNAVTSDVHYGFIKRDIVQQEIKSWKDLGWKEEPTGIYPVLSNIYVEDENEQLNIFLNGIKEYEAKEGGLLELTLYRSIGWLGKPDLERRPGKASGQEFKYVPTPDSQLLGKQLNWEIGLMFDKLKEDEIKKTHNLYFDKNIYYQNQELDRFTGPLKYFVSNKWKNEIEKNHSLFNKFVMADNIEISIVKAIDKKKVLIRYVNHSNETINDPIIINDDHYINIYNSNLREEILDKVDINQGLKTPSVDKKQVKTIIIERR